MTDHWGSWPEDQPDWSDVQPDFAGLDGGDFAEPPSGRHPEDGGYPVEDFDPGEDVAPGEDFDPEDEDFGPGAHDAPRAEDGFGPADLDGPTEDTGPAEDTGPGGSGSGSFGYGGIDAHVDEAPGPDPYLDGEAGMGPAGPPEPPGEAGFGAADPPVGADPDLAPYGDAADWPEAVEPAVDLGPPPEPVDGWPWADPTVLGSSLVGPPVESTAPAAHFPDPAELAGYAGEVLPAEGDPWAALAGSEDPATSALARFWAPPDTD